MQKPVKKSKPVTAGYLERAALHYLGRFSSTRGNLVKVLDRKVRRRNENNQAANEEQMGWINDVADKCVRLGYVDDKQYALSRARSMLRRGKPIRSIASDLRFKGVASDLVETVLAEVQEAIDEPEVDADKRAAAAYARRRRFGAYRSVRYADKVEEKAEKELQSMMRAGFHPGLAKEILGLSRNEIDGLIEGLG